MIEYLLTKIISTIELYLILSKLESKIHDNSNKFNSLL